MIALAAKIVLLVAVFVPTAFALVRADGSAVESQYEPVERPVAWSDRVFLDRPIAAGWLSARGAEYRRWAKRHPFAAYKIELADALGRGRLYANAPAVNPPSPEP